MYAEDGSQLIDLHDLLFCSSVLHCVLYMDAYASFKKMCGCGSYGDIDEFFDLGGQRVGNRGYFFAPTLLDEVPDDALIMNEEPFGPIVAVTEFTETDEVIRRANALSLGLAAYVFTKSLSNSRRISEGLECGMVGVNTLTVSMAEAPFGGVKDSGYGYEGGIEGISAYLVDKFVAESD